MSIGVFSKYNVCFLFVCAFVAVCLSLFVVVFVQDERMVVFDVVCVGGQGVAVGDQEEMDEVNLVVMMSMTTGVLAR